MFTAENISIRFKDKPSFPIRRWSLTHLQGPIEFFGDDDNWATILKQSADIKRWIDIAPSYGITSVELTGRPREGGIDIDWLINYKDFPKVRRMGLEAEFTHHKQELIREIGKWCEEKGLELWLWSHEIYLPDEFYQAYSEIRGGDYPICFSHPLIKEVIAHKIYEFFQAVPNVTGLVLSLSECGGIEVTSDVGCRCARCRKLSIPERLRMIVDYIREPLRELGKGLVVRTFTHARYREVLKHTETEHMLQAFSNLPEDVILMSKYCPQDFYGYEYPDDALIGAFKNPHLVEFTLWREIIGGSWTPNLTPRDFKRRFENAYKKKCIGVVGRVNHPNMFDSPYQTIDYVNAFNLYCFSQLAQDVDTDIDTLWGEYLSQRYPQADRRKLRQMLEPTEELAEKIYLTLGTYGITYAHRIPHTYQAETAFEFLSLAKWREDFLDIHNKIQSRDLSILPQILVEKDEAIKLAQDSLDLLEEIKAQLGLFEYLQMKVSFIHAKQTAELLKFLSEVFFRARAIDAGTSDDYGNLLRASFDLFNVTKEIRTLFGKDAWPTKGTPMRGISIEQFVVEAYRPLLYKLINQPLPKRLVRKYTDIEVIEYLYPLGSIEHFWRILLGLVEPNADENGKFVRVTIEEPIKKVEIDSDKMIAVSSSGSLTLPLFKPVNFFVLPAGSHIVRIEQNETIKLSVG